MADSRHQAPFIKPLVPFTGPICGGLCDGMMVVLSGTVVQDCDRYVLVFVNGKQFVEYKHRMPLSKVNAIGVAGGVELSVISFQKTVPGVIFLPKPHQPQPYIMPYRTSMAGGLYPSKSVIITGTVLPNANRFHVDLKQNEDIAFHLNPRFSETTVVRNSKLNQTWGSEERGLPSGMPFVCGQNFTIWILCEAHCFKVTVNGQHQFDYNHRVSNLQQINLLEIEGDVLLTCVQV